MGENHKENLLKCLRQWRDITARQREVLAEGDLEQFERLNRVSLVLQSRFDNSLSKAGDARRDETVAALLEEIRANQAVFVDAVSRDIKELAAAIGRLAQGRRSLGGYRRNPHAAPRFKSERT